jgi:hypothetical protein
MPAENSSESTETQDTLKDSSQIYYGLFNLVKA